MSKLQKPGRSPWGLHFIFTFESLYANLQGQEILNEDVIGMQIVLQLITRFEVGASLLCRTSQKMLDDFELLPSKSPCYCSSVINPVIDRVINQK